MRLRRLKEEFGDRVHIEWRSFLLRPQPDPSRTLEKFRAYARSWLRVAADPALLQATVDEYNEALAFGINGVPAVALAGRDGFIIGAHPLELYRRWIERTLRERPGA